MEEKNRHPLAKQDINQLISLSMILRERNLSRAARLLDVTQSAMSHNLSKARTKYADKLLVRQGQEMVRTPFAERLLNNLEPLVEHARIALDIENRGNEEQIQQKVTLSVPDFLLEHIGFTLIQRAKHFAPHLSLDFVSLDKSEQCDIVITDATLEFQGDAVCLYSEALSRLSPISKADSSWLSYVNSNNWLAHIDKALCPSMQTESWCFFMRILQEKNARSILPLSLAKSASKHISDYCIEELDGAPYCQWFMYKKSSSGDTRAWLDAQIETLAMSFFTA